MEPLLYITLRGCEIVRPEPYVGREQAGMVVLFVAHLTQGARVVAGCRGCASLVDLYLLERLCASCPERSCAGEDGSGPVYHPAFRTHVRGVAQPGRAPASGAGGRRFESSLPDHFYNQQLTRSSVLHGILWQGVNPCKRICMDLK